MREEKNIVCESKLGFKEGFDFGCGFMAAGLVYFFASALVIFFTFTAFVHALVGFLSRFAR